MRKPLSTHLFELMRLAAPVVIARAGILTMATADTIMLGHYAAADLAWYGIGVAPFIVLLLIGIGLLTGTLVMTSHSRGAGTPRECGAVWRRSLPYAVLIGIAGTVLAQFAEPFFLLLGQSPDIAAGGGRVTTIAGIALIPTLLSVTTSFFLEGLARPAPGMIVILCGNLLNILLNWLLIFGHWGLPAMGAEGAILATSLTRFAMAVAAMSYVWWMPDRDVFGVRRPPAGPWWREGREQWRLGYAAGVSQGLETTAFNSLTIMAGILGPVALASYAVVMNVTALIFMLALGLGAATAVRVGAARGAGDRPGIATAGWVGLGAAVAVMGGFAMLLYLLPADVAAVYSDEPHMRAALPALIALIALVLIPDGGQVVMSFALRGAGDAWVPTASHLVSYLGVMMPVAWLLAFPAGRGVPGLIEAIALASVASLSILAIRFWIVTRRR
ncbi:MAG: MATE family efflux transporter [Alphaproteobacteria bacterium]|nr:MATE family efflux transporter [Alphaproteobacteria bacterium]